ncbi:hypothetical protein [Rhizobium changzhiense]|uniref:hypothetical protein n=1 Tax=Rhizobium changzhiense TaxID=2692317 RepID=UPI003B8A6348
MKGVRDERPEKMTVELQRIHLESKKTVLLITHSIPEAVYLSDRVIVMSERPGSIASIYYDIDLARPRDLSVMASPQFALYTKTIRQQAFISAMSCSSCSLAGYQNCNRVADQP